jgi:YHS domain-containing protein
VAAHARGGQVLCTGHAVSAAAGLADVRVVPVGPVRFKNVPEPVDLFELMSRTGSDTVLDPVCHMHVDVQSAPARLPFGGATYHFCSFQCAEAFARNPGGYVEP